MWYLLLINWHSWVKLLETLCPGTLCPMLHFWWLFVRGISVLCWSNWGLFVQAFYVRGLLTGYRAVYVMCFICPQCLTNVLIKGTLYEWHIVWMQHRKRSSRIYSHSHRSHTLNAKVQQGEGLYFLQQYCVMCTYRPIWNWISGLILLDNYIKILHYSSTI